MARLWPFNAANYLTGLSGPTLVKFNTCSFWLKLTGHVTTQQTFVSAYNGFGQLIRSSDSSLGHLGFFWVDSAAAGHEAIGATLLSAGTWYHVCARYDNGTKVGDIFLNGVKDGTASAANILSANGDTKWTFGRRAAGTLPADAAMAEFAMWEVALPDAEIAALARGATPPQIGHILNDYWPTLGSYDNGAEFATRFAATSNLSLTGALATAPHPPTCWPLQIGI